MATIIKVNRTVPNGAKVYNALNQILNGLGTLQELDNLRADAIGTSQTVMSEVFGLYSDADAQALNDRWIALIAAYEDSGNAEFAKLRDLLAFNGSA